MASHSLGLTNNPPELLDHICSFIDKPKDLLAVSLTSKQFYQLVVPTHIQFRIIRCDVRRRDLWKHLSVRPGLASKIVSLELVSELHDRSGTVIVPISVLDDNATLQSASTRTWPRRTIFDSAVIQDNIDEFEDDCLCALISVIQHLTSLRHFRWEDYTIRPTNYDTLFSTLHQSCPRITEVEILNNIAITNKDITNSPVSVPTFKSFRPCVIINYPQLWSFSNLTRFSFATNDRFAEIEALDAYTVKLLRMMVNQCPGMVSMQLRLSHIVDFMSLENIFINTHWPHLRDLSFDGSSFDGPTSFLERFYNAHPQLETLYIPHDFESVTASALPNLRSLHRSGQYTLIHESVSPDVASHLKHISIVPVNHPLHVDNTIRFLKGMKMLRSIVISPSKEYFDTVADTLSHLHIERLAFHERLKWLILTKSNLDGDNSVSKPPMHSFRFRITYTRSY